MITSLRASTAPTVRIHRTGLTTLPGSNYSKTALYTPAADVRSFKILWWYLFGSSVSDVNYFNAALYTSATTHVGWLSDGQNRYNRGAQITFQSEWMDPSEVTGIWAARTSIVNSPGTLYAEALIQEEL